MKLIKPGFEILEQKNLLQHMELCGRVAYKSEDKITESSADKFIKMIVERGHTAVLEHGTVYLTVPVGEGKDLHRYQTCPYSNVFERTDNFYITTNYRVLFNNRDVDLIGKYGVEEPNRLHERRVTVRFILDRGISHEFVRHRVFSFVQESTRFCNYSKSKFGSELNIIIPVWFKSEEDHDWGLAEWKWYNSMGDAEEYYSELLDQGWTPQQARSVLPNSLKTELIMTGTEEQWKGFFALRTAADAHPQARELAVPLEDHFKDEGLCL